MTEKSKLPQHHNDHEAHDATPLDKVPAKPPLTLWARLWKYFKHTTRVIIYIPLLILILLAVLIGTPFGARMSVMLANQFVPNLALDLRSGTINKQLEFNHASWSMDGVAVEVDDLSLSWLPTCLFNKQICVDKLHASGVRVRVATDEFADDVPSESTVANARTTQAALADNQPANTDKTNESKDEVPEPLILPVVIGLNELDLNSVEVSVNDMRYNASRLQGKALWNSKGLRVNYLYSDGLLVDIPLASDDVAAPNNTTEVNDDWAMAALPVVYMSFPIYLEQLISNNSVMVLGARTDDFAKITLAGSYVDDLIDVQQLAITHDYGEATLEGDIRLNHDYPMNINADFSLNNVAEIPELTQQKIKLSAHNGFDDLAVTLAAEGDFTINFDSNITLSKPEMPYRIDISKAQIQWPLIKPDYVTDIKTLSSTGDFNQQHVVLDGQFLSPYHPQLEVNSAMQLSHTNVDIADIVISSDAGDIAGQASLDWGNDFSWQAKLDTTDLQLEKIDYLYELTELSSHISGILTTTGKVSDTSWEVNIVDSDLSGSLNQYPLSVKGQVQFDNNFAINAKDLQAQALGTTLLINGQADTVWDVDALLDVPDISQWLPDSKGSITAKIDVTGDAKQPIVDINGQVADFDFADMKLDRLTLTGHYLPLNEHQFSVNLASTAFSWSELDLTDVELIASGDLGQQTLQLSTGGELAINTQLSNIYTADKQRFDTEVNALSLTNMLGDWQLDKPITIVWDQLNQLGSASPFCINHPSNSLCLIEPANFGTQGDIHILAQGTPGRLLQPILPERLVWIGDSSLDAKLNWSEVEKLQADVDLTLSEGKLELKRSENDRIDIIYDLVNLHVTLDEQQLTGQLSVQADSISDISSQVNISTQPSRELSGHINIDELDLTGLQGFFPELATLQGLFSTDLTLLGTLNEPEVGGKMTLSKAAIATTNNPTLIENINLIMELAGQQGNVTGDLTMGKGQANINGKLAWPEGNFNGEIDIKGKKLAFIQPPIAILDITPDVKINFSKNQLAITGTVDIPSGEITLVQLAEGGVAISSDVVFKDSISEQEEKVSPYAIVADLNINVGKNLNIDGMGLNGKLEGTLLLQQQAFKPPLLFGDIKVNNGSYKFMGQTLTISTGEVQFVGPSSVPNLNIEAVKEIKDEDLTAGVRVTGTAMQPVVTLFSNPAKEQAEILSYIVTGTGFANSGNDQNNALMMSAALSLGSQFGGGAMNNIGSTATGLIEKMGFSNVQLDANDEGRFAISGYIGEDLMVKYGIGVFNPGYEMTVRYYIFSQLYLETVSGNLNQSLDIYYSFDID
ncbi:translocation/assembly module TamB domain-containing protein [Shewanella sp. 5_MG-2023]|uniref:translocation/assembly module TamB domain-containing protein n=1 Tax=unclassified Shewanella TaxID=196818 RepID=UPI0026E24DC9|nr:MULTISPECIES: translocation/assembly module TamB domain-containing protein [unclassified Shewanella]MDO6639466.1 translocation/assembly module TamB domain-containing protein [Shewanella sp. 5_MG-2023]MDO6775966.1 translocation/assembly module TamB domain-containing protein [Shewanella sp. 3_MG-2023]